MSPLKTKNPAGKTTATIPSAQPCVDGAIGGGLTRTTFFDGMFLTQKDLEGEQFYWRVKRSLTNRALGNGIVWGLKLQRDDSGFSTVWRLKPGYALDCCGNDLVVQGTFEEKESDLFDPSDPAMQDAIARAQQTKGGLADLCVALQYVECPESPRNVYQDACTTQTGDCEPSRMRETARLVLAAPEPAFKGPLENFAESLPPQKAPVAPTPEGAPANWAKSGNYSLSVRAGDQEGVWRFDGSGGPGSPVTALAAYAQGAAGSVPIQLELKPDKGYVFVSGQVTAPNGLVLATVTAPFALQLAWTWQLAQLPLAAGQQPLSASFNITNLVVSRVFDSSSAPVLGLPLTVSGHMTVLGSGPYSAQICIDSATGTQTQTDGARLNASSCFAASASGNGAAANPGELVLAALYMWLTGLLGNESASDPAAYNGQRTLASWIYLTAWRAIGGDPSDADDALRAELADLLDTLLATWCDQLFYAGPRCRKDIHAVILGTVAIDANGGIQGFDRWAGRRYVLTGPLLNHWGAQLGLAPIDVTAGRFASMVCCLVAQEQPVPATLPALPPLSASTWMQTGYGVQPGGAPAGSVQSATFPSGARAGFLVSDGVRIAYGEADSVERQLAAQGLKLAGDKQVSFPQLAARFAQALAAEAPKPGASWVRYTTASASSAQLQLIIAEPGHAQDPEPGAIGRVRKAARERVLTIIEALGDPSDQGATGLDALALPPLVDFLTELLLDLPLSALAAPSGAAASYPALAAAGIDSFAAALERGPERALAVLGASTAATTNLNAIYKALDRAISTLVQKTMRAWAKGQGFTRVDLAPGAANHYASFIATEDGFVSSFIGGSGGASGLVVCAAARAFALAPS